ncbi:MAG TPA: hypothetical protein DCM87_15340 [Planctomycetes bacterium]|nr:hypothetical protein [Planctomycetota bacterium]
MSFDGPAIRELKLLDRSGDPCGEPREHAGRSRTGTHGGWRRRRSVMPPLPAAADANALDCPSIR